jgi:molybdopterin synthase catalytic subunit
MSQNVRVGIVESAISPEACLKEVGARGHGAEVSFFGIIRELNQGRKVRAVSYDIFVPLAEATFREIAQEALSKCGDSLRLLLIHRKGRLEVGEVAVAVVVSGPHRGETYEASRLIIEAIKHRAPIWKKEHYEDGESEWVQGHALCQHS